MFIQSLRIALSKPSTSIQLCLIGVVGGLSAAAIIVLFRLSIGFIQNIFLGASANYTTLMSWQLFLLPLVAVIFIIGIAKMTGFKHYRLGVPFVIHRLKMHYGNIPFATSINQFFGGVLALASGFVVGKEGPTVHLAAAASQYVGRWFKLPFNSLRILAGCGIAAGIAAAFNTPFAAVIFVMEVVIRDYKVHVFVPVMLAAACGSVITRLVFGDYSELAFLSFQAMAFWQLPVLIIFGIFLGILATLFNKQLMWLMRLTRPLNMISRLLIAGLITGTIAYFMPHALGAEFIGVNTFLQNSPTSQLILAVFVAKFVLAIVAIALGVPGGIIGAVMVIGILAGVLFLQPIQYLFNLPDLSTNYALLGLAGLLAAVLHAPMAALSAAMELSSTQQVILPAIITIVSAHITSKQLCNNRSIFLQQLEYQELPYTTTTIRDELQNTGVMALMQTNVTLTTDGLDPDMYSDLQANPDTFIVNRVTNKLSLKERPSDSVYEPTKWQQVSLAVGQQKNISPIIRQDLQALSEQNTLAEVYECLYIKRNGGVVVVAHNDDNNVYGVITWGMLHKYLLRQQH
ncbi:chloride channel protein [Glaciecola petra]|uniref:Chloride channel protein n=1 Tax=Glaciecola petra TaxID=3075602 RepID=A0ABU2ZS91_9ALTE|nr:chloride channel protein [Aestuariibacter sp. P117]MDT0595499.1 chloride channel protein [Aestuariibacter sp. P117]